MIYRIEIGTNSRKGMFLKQIEKVVNFDGELDKLLEIMKEKYSGFIVNCYPVENVEIVQNMDIKRTAKSITKSEYKQTMFIGNLNLNKILSEVSFNEIMEQKIKLEKVVKEAELELTNLFKDRIEVSYVKSIKINLDSNTAMVNLYTNGDIFIDREYDELHRTLRLRNT